MKLTGLACTEAIFEAEEDGTRERERAKDNAGGVPGEQWVRRPIDAMETSLTNVPAIKGNFPFTRYI